MKKMYQYNVYLDGKMIDSLWYMYKVSVAEVTRSLVEHDGYDPNIVVKVSRS